MLRKNFLQKKNVIGFIISLSFGLAIALLAYLGFLAEILVI